MLGILLELILSYLLLRYLAKNDLNAIGLMPKKNRLLQLALGFLWPVLYFCFYEYTLSLLVHNPWKINPSFTYRQFFSSLIYLIKSVAYEDLIFRGALLYLLIRKYGAQKAILISASAFGIYHWFAWNAFGNPIQMLMVFATTASAGYVFAYAFSRTGSMYLPAGLHLGCNLASMVVFSKSESLGQQWLVKSFPKDQVVPVAVISIMALIIHFAGFQILTWLLLKRFAKHNEQLQVSPRSVSD